MGRRQLLVLVSALAMVLIAASLVGGLVGATQSDGGREWIRRQLAREIGRGMHGRFYLGKLSGSFLTDLRVDSVALIDPEDSVLVASGPVVITYDPRDIFDGRIILRTADITRALLVIRKEHDGRWNFRKVFPVEEEGPPGPPPARRAFGALMVFENVAMHGAEFQLTFPWNPDDSLKGARRDSAIRVHLADKSTEVRRVPVRGKDVFQRTWRWTAMNGELSRVRFRHPDSTGRRFEITRLDVDEHIPPFNFRDLRGHALWRGDTVWFDTPHFSLPGSVGAATGKVEWPRGPQYWDVHVRSDSVALADVHWVYDNLPRAGGGSMRLHIKSRTNPDIIDYAITEMDVRSNGSHLVGDMTYGVGGPVLDVRNVSLDLRPADFTLLETLNGNAFPYPWRGTITGTVRASGGPVNHFQVEEAQLAFADRNVPGATAAGTGHGEIDIVFPGLAKFHGFSIDVSHFDLRTPQFLNASFPRLNGTVSGTAILDSIWTDIRIRDADITHRDGDDAAPSRFTGATRVTLGDDLVAFDAAVTALPLSATTLAKSYPSIPLRGDYRGPLRVTGTVADLGVSADLVGDAGRIQVDGQFDADAPVYRAVARGSVSGLSFRSALAMPKMPASAFDGRFSLDLSGDSLANLSGTARLFADRSVVDGVRVYRGAASLRFGSGLMHVDSLRLESVAGMLTASGGLGIVAGREDSLHFRADVDSLGGLRRWIVQASRDTAAARADSLEGIASISGTIAGRLSRFALDARADASTLRMRTTTARALTASAHLDALPDTVRGTFSARADTLRSGSLSLARLTADAQLLGGWRALGRATAESPVGARARASAEIHRDGDTTRVRLDSVSAFTTRNAWVLGRSASIVFSPGGGLAMDTLVLTGDRGGRLLAAGKVPARDTVSFLLLADAIPLADVGELVQAGSGLGGSVTMRADLRGTRQHPDLFFAGNLRDATIAGIQLDQLIADGRYANRRLTTSLSYYRLGTPAIHAEATLPVDLAFAPAGPRLLEEPLTARIRTDSVGLALFESFSSSVRGARGTLAVDVDVAGTWRHPRFTGSLAVHDGTLGFTPLGDRWRLTGIEAEVGFLGDSVDIRRLLVRSGSSRTSSAELRGWLSLRDAENPSFRLAFSAQGFNIVNRPRVADLDISGNLELTGRYRDATLGGLFTVDRGTIFIPELYQKRVISLDDPDLYRVVDTTLLINRRLLPQPPSTFLDNLTLRSVPVRMGPDVWLRSAEANINLGGNVFITRSRDPNGPPGGPVLLALDGPLQTVRGTYRLNLGPVQRAFTVESGEVRFYGDPDPTHATLNISATHTVRQFNPSGGARPDVRVRVRLGGTLAAPTAELSSPDSLRVTNADLVSYLVTGGPSYDITGRGDYTSTAARVLLTSVGSVLGNRAGGFCDDAQVSTAGLDAYQGTIRGVSGSVLQGTRFNCAKQVFENTFVRVDAGLCQVGQFLGAGNASSDPRAFADAIGVKLDVRLGGALSFSAGLEPPTEAVLCSPSASASARGFAPTPRQVGFDLFRLWRF